VFIRGFICKEIAFFSEPLTISIMNTASFVQRISIKAPAAGASFVRKGLGAIHQSAGTSHQKLSAQLRRFAFCALAAGVVVALTACKKTEAPSAGTVQMAGVNLDLPKLDTEFQNATPEVQTTVIQIKTLFRGGRLAQMIKELDKLGNNPSLTEPQKKVINDLIGQLGQVMAKIPTPPG
jgi:hypothetical protein